MTMFGKRVEEGIDLFLEKNVPTNPSKWAYYKAQAKKKFDVYPSAYANGWAAKQYKAAGGGWRKEKKKKSEVVEDVGIYTKNYDVAYLSLFSLIPIFQGASSPIVIKALEQSKKTGLIQIKKYITSLKKGGFNIVKAILIYTKEKLEITQIV